MLISLEGRMGQGKTLSMTALGVTEHFENGATLFASYHLNEVPYTYLNLEKFYELFKQADNGEVILSHCVFLLDEAYLFMDSRASSSKLNRIFNSFVFQTRKRGVDMYVSTHDLSRLDRRVRSAIDLRISCRFNTVTEKVSLRIRDMHTGQRRRLLIYGPPFYSFFDTKEIVTPQSKLYTLNEGYIKG